MQTYGDYRRSKNRAGGEIPLMKKRQRIAPPREEMFDKRRRVDPDDPTVAASSASADEDGSRGFRPSMLSFKSFLQTQDDSITDDEALDKYGEYKQEFNRQQLNEFFVAHKEEEWFREKYHPDLHGARLATAATNVKQRLDLFFDMHSRGLMKELRLESVCSAQISALLDCFVLRLEGGTLDEADKLVAGDSLDEELHKTTSIHLRTIHPAVKREELESVCRKFPGFLRLALSDPQPDKRWMRKGWVSFTRDTKIKETCFSLSSVRLKDVELSPVINKDLSVRIRSVSGIANDKSQMRADLMAASNLIKLLDKRWGLHVPAKPNADAAEAVSTDGAGEPSKLDIDSLGAVGNPFLENITEYMIEEMSAEEDELLGYSANHDSASATAGSGEKTVEHDAELASVLDRLVIYLRLVHSIDFYNVAHYQTEDEMPNRCGIFHVRENSEDNRQHTESAMTEYREDFSKKLKKLYKNWDVVSDEETPKLGLKNEDEAVSMFIQANTEELGNDKYLCPLSGKKFKGIEFVRKHIFNKHSEKVDNVKKDVEFFNQFIKDPRRPSLPERPKPAAVAKPAASDAVSSGGWSNSGPSTGFHGGRRNFDDRRSPDGRPKVSVKDRLGYKKPAAVAPDPRGLVDYADVDFGDDLFN